MIELAAKIFGELHPARLIKSSAMSYNYFEYALKKTNIRFAVVRREAHLGEAGIGIDWTHLGDKGRFKVYYHS